MAYDKKLAQRVRNLLHEEPGYSEKKMFGGVCYLLHGNMACGIIEGDLIVRIGPKGYQSALKLPHTRKLDITGRDMKGWVMVSRQGHDSNQNLAQWVKKGMEFSRTLPPK